jgi:hypothetical protein
VVWLGWSHPHFVKCMPFPMHEHCQDAVTRDEDVDSRAPRKRIWQVKVMNLMHFIPGINALEFFLQDGHTLPLPPVFAVGDGAMSLQRCSSTCVFVPRSANLYNPCHLFSRWATDPGSSANDAKQRRALRILRFAISQRFRPKM